MCVCVLCTCALRMHVHLNSVVLASGHQVYSLPLFLFRFRVWLRLGALNHTCTRSTRRCLGCFLLCVRPRPRLVLGRGGGQCCARVDLARVGEGVGKYLYS